MGDEFLMRPRMSRIFWRGRYLDYPLKGGDVVKKLGPVELLLCGLSYMKAAVTPKKEAESLEDWVSQRFGKPVDEGVLVAHDLTQEELAQLVGASRETVNKALADFSARGWVKLEARAVTLLDVERLQRRSR